MLKRFLTLTTACVLTVSLCALPARRIKRTVTQPDGTTLTITMQGDEHLHYICTNDGLPLMRTATGAYCYATINNAQLHPSTVMAHEATTRSANELEFVSQQVPTQRTLGALRKERVMMKKRPPKRLLQQMETVQNSGEICTSQKPANITGQRKGLVVLVNFKDTKMQSAHTQECFDDQFNLEGYHVNGNSGSVHDYFKAQSYGLFDLTFDVVGPVTLPRNMASYGANDANGNDRDAVRMVYEAVKLAKKEHPELNFKDYDWDGDGEVEQVFVIYAGYGEASDVYGTMPNTIWPHEWQLSAGGYQLEIDGVKIDTYGCSAELLGNEDYPLMMDGIGSACHEFSHCLGLPDFYDTSDTMSPAFGLDEWSLMDYGCYCADGFCPAGYTAYERWMSGWLTPTVLDVATTISDMKALVDAPEAYVIYNEAHPDEYYLLENRQQWGSDSELQGHGLLVLHVDYDKATWFNNEVNNVKSHPRCSIIAADNKWTTKTLKGDPFPGSSNRTELTDGSRPVASLFNENVNGLYLMSKPLTNITESASGLISFNFMGGGTMDGIDAPKVDDGNGALPVYDVTGRFMGKMSKGRFERARRNSGTWLIR